MPRQIIQCDCKQGALEVIARTKEKLHGSSISDDIPESSSLTIFYSCDSCNKVYRQDINTGSKNYRSSQDNLSVIIDGKTAYKPHDNIDDIIPYTGILSKQDIIKKAPRTVGIFER
jgi:hypothetical protein